jgi:hypothetical protein
LLGELAEARGGRRLLGELVEAAERLVAAHV